MRVFKGLSAFVLPKSPENFGNLPKSASPKPVGAGWLGGAETRKAFRSSQFPWRQAWFLGKSSNDLEVGLGWTGSDLAADPIREFQLRDPH